MPGIAIRRYRSEDSGSLHAAARESVSEIFPWLPWCHPDYALEEAQAWIASRGRLFEEGTEYAFAVVDSGDRLLGGSGLNLINPIHRFANLGYWVRSTETGRGVATEAIRLLANFAFSETNLIRLEIVCDVANVRSQRAAEKAGAIREGVHHDRLFLHDLAHDGVIFAILRSRQPR